MGDGNGAAKPQQLALVRRFEAAGFRAWPATAVHYDGAWVVRLTAGHPSKRLNSVNPLDPGDVANIEDRIARAARRFEAYGRPVTLRISPLSGAQISDHLDAEGWSCFSESIVMRMPLSEEIVAGAMDQIPLRDLARFVNATMAVHQLDPGLKAGLSEVIGSIRAAAGLFVLEHEDKPVSTAVCVHDGDLAGLFEIATDDAMRGQGFGRRVVLSALKWAHLRGARQAWLQVEADNAKAIGLYKSLGFQEVYRYVFRRPPEG